MKGRIVLIFSLLVLGGVGLGLFNQQKPKLVLIGDSTMADYSQTQLPLSGWGQALRIRLQGSAYIDNKAVPGSSTLSYLSSHWYETVKILNDGDYLLIQFGHNDERASVALEKFKQNLARFVADARGAGAIPILITPLPRYRFSAGHVIDTHGHYADSVRRLASEIGVPLVDLSRLATAMMEREGELRVREWYMLHFNDHDDVHLNQTGSEKIAIIVEGELVQLGILQMKTPSHSGMSR